MRTIKINFLLLVGLSLVSPAFSQDEPPAYEPPPAAAPPAYNQAGAVSVDMGGDPNAPTPPPATAILAIYRGPGYFDDALLDITEGSIPSSTTPSPDSTEPTSSENQSMLGGEALPPPPILPPELNAFPQDGETPPVPPLTPESTSDPAPPPLDQPQPDQSQPAVANDGAVLPGTPLPIAQEAENTAPPSSSEALPPPPMLETLPAFPQSE